MINIYIKPENLQWLHSLSQFIFPRNNKIKIKIKQILQPRNEVAEHRWQFSIAEFPGLHKPQRHYPFGLPRHPSELASRTSQRNSALLADGSLSPSSMDMPKVFFPRGFCEFWKRSWSGMVFDKGLLISLHKTSSLPPARRMMTPVMTGRLQTKSEMPISITALKASSSPPNLRRLYA
jgi:hypothetical protein